MRRSIAAVLSLAVIGVIAPVGDAGPSAAASSFSVEMIGTPPGKYSRAVAINSAGTIVGQIYTQGSAMPGHAFRWTSAGGMSDLGTLGGAESKVRDVNDTEMIVGTAQTVAANDHAFAWTPVGGMVDIGTLGTGNSAMPHAVNNAGLVVGEATVDASHVHAFVWSAGGGIIDIGTLGGSESAALAVNESGVVVGWSKTSGDVATHAFKWDATNGIIDIGTLGGNDSFAYAINDTGQIAGLSDTSSESNKHVFRRDGSGAMHDLGRTMSFVISVVGIDDDGNVAGYGFGGSANQVAFVANPSTGLVELDTGRPNATAGRLSAAGQLVGTTYGGGIGSTAYVYDVGRKVLRRLGSLADETNAIAVNEAGVIVGSQRVGLYDFAVRYVATNSPTVSLGTATVTEANVNGSRTVKFAVTLSQPSTSLVTVPYSVMTSAHAAAATAIDFKSKSGNVSFKPAAGSGLSPTTQFVVATIVADLDDEGDEQFAVSLGQPTGSWYTLGASVVAATILDDDPAGAGATVSVGDATVWEADSGTAGKVTVPIVLSAAPGISGSVKVTVAEASADSPTDFAAYTKTLNFGATTKQAYATIVIKADVIPEPDETISITLSDASGGIGLGRSTGTATILDDDL